MICTPIWCRLCRPCLVLILTVTTRLTRDLHRQRPKPSLTHQLMASVPRSPARTRSKGNHVSPGSGSVGEADDKLSEAGILITEDFDPDANITDKGKQSRMSRKRRKVQETAADSVLDDPEFKDTQEKRKAARPSRQGKYIAGRRGHLKLMTEIPIDTLHEIFRQLDPADLLTLSWSSKSLRLVITEKSARYIWQEVTSFLLS